MRSPFDLRTRALGNERGQTLILVTVSLISLVAIAALAIDMTTLYVARAEIQHAADAAALAGAKAFVDSGVTTDPTNTTLQGLAQTMAQDFVTAVVSQNNVSGSPPTLIGTPAVTFTSGGNPHISVTLQRTDLPLFFARIWGNATAAVSATALAEAYNPSYSQANTGSFTPAAPRCVKPFLVPNNYQYQTGHPPFVIPTTGAINSAAGSFIGKTITLTSACRRGSSCTLPPGSPPGAGQYLPMLLPNTHQYCPSPSAPGCSSRGSNFEKSTECCDGTTFDFGQCGVSQTTAAWDPNTNPGRQNGAARQGLQCLIHTTSQNPPGNNPQQDTLNVSLANNGPLQIQPGSYSQSRYNVAPGSLISASDSIITVPLFDVKTWPQVNIVGFLQLFVNYPGPTPRIAPNGDMNAYILNVIGCGSSLASGSAVSGGGVSAIPVRLIHN